MRIYICAGYFFRLNVKIGRTGLGFGVTAFTTAVFFVVVVVVFAVAFGFAFTVFLREKLRLWC